MVEIRKDIYTPSLKKEQFPNYRDQRLVPGKDVAYKSSSRAP
jgi:hypothetical protein